MTEPLQYAQRPVCDLHLPSLNQPREDEDAPEPGEHVDQVLVVGNSVTCPHCGRIWTVVEQVGWGSPVQVVWQCTEAPPADWTPPVDPPSTPPDGDGS